MLPFDQRHFQSGVLPKLRRCNIGGHITIARIVANRSPGQWKVVAVFG